MFLYTSWLLLPIETRMKLATQFGIKKTGPTHVADNVIQSDGYSIKDIENALTVSGIQSYINTKETDSEKLWSMLVDKINGKLPLEIEEERIQKETLDIKNIVAPEVGYSPTALAISDKPKRGRKKGSKNK
jgi:hypothetical protein